MKSISCVLSRHCWQGRHIRPSSSFPLRFLYQPRFEGTRSAASMAGPPDYGQWSKDDLITRVKDLESQLKQRYDAGQKALSEGLEANATKQQQQHQKGPGGGGKDGKKKKGRPFDASRHSTRFIALKFAYLGKNYGPFEYSPTNLKPAIEDALWKALTTACLIFPKDPDAVDWSCCDYAKCGRTDVGVSSFGQVISLRVRSNRPLEPVEAGAAPGEATAEAAAAATGDGAGPMDVDGASAGAPAEGKDGAPEKQAKPAFDPIRDEIQYCRVLNRLLPDDIRVYAWCPSPPPGFNARFSCRERQYRYFFTQPAFLPIPHQLEVARTAGQGGGRPKNGWLDIEAMREAARHFEGFHDLRNFCQVDGSKMITDFRREIYSATIEEAVDHQSALPYLNQAMLRPVADGSAAAAAAAAARPGEAFPKVFSFNVNGSGFLWHQIRRMVGILFLVGQGLERPSVVAELLDVERNPTQPHYAMADESPLVLWDCVFPDADDTGRREALEWIYCGEEGGGAGAANKYGHKGLLDTLWTGYREKKLDEVLAHQLLQRLSEEGTLKLEEVDASKAAAGGRARGKPQAGVKLFEGGNNGRLGGTYVPLMKRPRMATTEEINDREAKRKGFASAEEYRARLKRRSGPPDGVEDV